MTSTTTLVRPEFRVVRGLREMGVEAQRAVVPRQRFREDLRARLVGDAAVQDPRPSMRVSGGDYLGC